MNKNIFFALLMSVFVSTTASAESIQWLINGSPGGTFHKRSTLYIEALEQQGVAVEALNLKKGSRAVEYLKTTDKPAAMVFIADFAAELNFLHNNDNFVAAEYVEGLFLCMDDSKKYSNTITLGATKGYNLDSFVGYLEGTGKNVKVIRYENSGKVLQGVLGGDAIAMVTNQKGAVKYQAKGGSCVFNTSQETRLGTPSVTEFTNKPFPTNASTVIAVNTDIDTLRTAVKAAQGSAGFVKWHTAIKMTPVTGLSRSEELAVVNEAEAGWMK